MKHARLAIGSAAVVIGIWVIIGEQMSGASADAVVNAPVITLRTPIAGDLALPERQIGSRVGEGEVLARVENGRVDRIRLDDLLMELEREKAALARMDADIKQTGAQRDMLLERTRDYRAHRTAELDARLAHAEARLAHLEGQQGADFLTLDQARERVAVLRIEVAAAADEVFLGDGYNDAPNAEQRMVELDGKLDALGTARQQAEAVLAALQERVDRERLRVNGAGAVELRAPLDGIYWEILEADGVNVQRGDPVVRLVDCGAAMVTLSVTERVYNRLAIGQPASFRLTDSTDLHQGTVARLAGSGAQTIYRHLAVAPSQKHLERHDVTLIVPGLQQASAEGCMIGRTGRAFFETRPLDWLRDLLR